jgi:hypothetical protein
MHNPWDYEEEIDNPCEECDFEGWDHENCEGCIYYG